MAITLKCDDGEFFFAMSEVGVGLNIDFELPVKNKPKKVSLVYSACLQLEAIQDSFLGAQKRARRPPNPIYQGMQLCKAK